jgi:hypothetical protein
MFFKVRDLAKPFIKKRDSGEKRDSGYAPNPKELIYMANRALKTKSRKVSKSCCVL